MTCSCANASHRPLDDFLPYIVPQVMGVPDPIAAHNARLAAIQFATETQAIKRTIHMYLQENVQVYSVAAPECETVMSVKEVSVSGRRYMPMHGSIDGLCGNRFAFEKPDTLYIGYAPCDEPDGIEVVANVVPGQDACYIDECFYDLYAETIAAGAISRLMAMPTAPWKNLQDARYFRGLFQEGMGSAKVLNAKGNVSGPMFMKPKRFV